MAKKTSKKTGLKKAAKRATKKKGGKTARKAARKTSRNKAVGEAEPRKQAAPSLPVGPLARRDDPEDLQTHVEVWEVYTRLRSKERVAKELRMSEDVVQQIIWKDHQRLRTMYYDQVEELAALARERSIEAHRLIEKILALYGRFIDEIMNATIEGRPTNIRDRDGVPMAVPDAVQFVTMTRAFDQLQRLAQDGLEASVKSRFVYTEPHNDEKDRGLEDGLPDFNTMDDYELATLMLEGGYKLSSMLKKRLKQAKKEAADPAGETEPTAEGGEGDDEQDNGPGGS